MTHSNRDFTEFAKDFLFFEIRDVFDSVILEKSSDSLQHVLN